MLCNQFESLKEYRELFLAWTNPAENLQELFLFYPGWSMKLLQHWRQWWILTSDHTRRLIASLTIYYIVNLGGAPPRASVKEEDSLFFILFPPPPAFPLTLQLYECGNTLQMKRVANPPKIIDKSSPLGGGRKKSPDKQTACVLLDTPLRNSSVDK